MGVQHNTFLENRGRNKEVLDGVREESQESAKKVAWSNNA